MKAIIKIAWRQVIDAGNTGNFERSIINASYKEFLIKSQAYNKDFQYKTFTEMVANDGRANSLHYKSGFAISNIIHQLNKKIPALKDEAGRQIEFANYEFQVIESDITNMAAHKVAIIYFTNELVLRASFGEYLVLCGLMDSANSNKECLTLKMQPGLSVMQYSIAEEKITTDEWN